MVVAVAELLKLVLDRPGFLAGTAGNSFPSGHVAAVAGLGVAVVVAVPGASRWFVAALVAGPAAALTGLATVVMQWHRPSGVVGSVLLAVTIGVLRVQLVDRPAAGNPMCAKTPEPRSIQVDERTFAHQRTLLGASPPLDRTARAGVPTPAHSTTSATTRL